MGQALKKVWTSIVRKVHREGWKVEEICKTLGVTRDAYYKSLKRRRRGHVRKGIVVKLVDEIRKDEPRVGTRKLHHLIIPALKRANMSIGRDRLFEVLRSSNRLVKPKKSFRKTTYSRHSYAVAPNLVKEMEITAPRQVLVSDITYIRIKGGKFAYLFLTTDAFSRMILGYHVSRDLTNYSARIALSNAISHLGDTEGIIHHSDRGCQYCCHEFLHHLKEHKMLSSMTDESHCYQNAIAERLNGILKDEFNLDSLFCSFDEIRLAVAKAVMVYNTKRTHYSLDLQTPKEVYDRAA
jgi:transposase InsO family protein